MHDVANIQKQGKTEIKQNFINLRAKGYTIRSIAKELKVSPQTLLNWEGDLNEEISSLKAVQLESLYAQYHLTKIHRLKEISGCLEVIQKELSTRGLSDISPDKLFYLNLKYLERAEKEYIEPKFLLKSNKTGTKLDSQKISSELYELLLKFRAGNINTVDAYRETSILLGILKAEEQGDNQEKVETLKILLEGKK